MTKEESTGAMRHTMTKEQLNTLYRLVDEFESDCTKAEHAYNTVYFAGIKTAIHQRLNSLYRNEYDK